MQIHRRSLPLLLAAAARPARAAEEGAPIRVGTLRFGSLAWELDVMQRHGLVRGFALEPVVFAAGPASQVALQAGRVDVILQDWLWVSRQRGSGADWSSAPVPAALGAVMVPAGSKVARLADLRGGRLGVAGGPIDKSWLLLRLYGPRQGGLDPETECEKTFGPPPLLAEQLRAGRLDAALTYWPLAARGEAEGMRPVLEVADILVALGLPRDMPMLGLVFGEGWAARNRTALQAFLSAMQAARAILAQSDDEWALIAPLTGAKSEAELARLRARYRSGFPGEWNQVKARSAAQLYDLLASVGGQDLVGTAPQLAPGTFWPGV